MAATYAKIRPLYIYAIIVSYILITWLLVGLVSEVADYTLDPDHILLSYIQFK